MALIVANTYQLSINGTLMGDRPFTNVFHVTPLGSGAPTVQEAANSMIEDCYPELMTHMQNSVVAQNCGYVDLSSSTGDSGTVSPSQPQGQANGNAVPPNTCWLAKWTATGGRSQRSGRSYLPGLDESSVDAAGRITSGLVSNLQADVDDFLTALQAADLALVIVSKTGASTGVARTVLNGTVQDRAATQRRRLRS